MSSSTDTGFRGALVPVACFLAASIFICAAPEAAQITGIRHRTSPEATRVVLDLSAPCDYRDSVWTAPTRIVLDLPGTTFAAGVAPFGISDRQVHRVRINRLLGPKAQVVLDMVGPRSYKVFTLPAQGEKPHRVVVDVYPSGSGQDPDELARPEGDGIPIIVIDPGHGGKDPGATQRGLREKDICFDVAAELKRQLELAGDVHVELTRTGDVFVPLRRRYRIAEERGADLFISIHANASRSRGARGAEVFFLTYGPATDRDAEELAKLENAADLMGGAPPETEGELFTILADLKKTKALDRSEDLSELILTAMREHRLMSTRTVRQARFVVLQSARIPSALVEIGFLSNPKDAQVIRRSDFTHRCAASLKAGILSYLRHIGVRAG